MYFWKISLLLLLTSCGYRLGDCGVVQRYHTISVPFVGGDSDGRLTEALVKEIASSTSLKYCASSGRLSLEAKIVNCGGENIGFQYDVNKQGQRTDRIVANERRLIYAVEFSVIDCVAGCTVLGPVCVRADVTYDFDPLPDQNELALFSVGQYVIIDQAEEAAQTPLYDELAHKIVAYLGAVW